MLTRNFFIFIILSFKIIGANLKWAIDIVPDSKKIIQKIIKFNNNSKQLYLQINYIFL